MVVVMRAVVLEQQFASSLFERQQYTPGLHWSTFQIGTLEPPPHAVVASNTSAAVSYLEGLGRGRKIYWGTNHPGRNVGTR